MSDSLADSVSVLREKISLDKVTYRSLRSESWDPPKDDPIPPQISIEIAFGENEEGEIDERKRARVSIGVVVEVPDGTVSVVVGAYYSIDVNHSVDMTSTTLTQYMNEHGILDIFPYVRSGVTDLSSKTLPGPIVLPLIRSGEVRFDLPPDGK